MSFSTPSNSSSADGDPAKVAYRFAVLTEALARTSAHTGHDALQELARALGETLSARRAHISRLCSERPGFMQIMALWDGETVTHGELFSIVGSASEQTVLEGERHYWNNLGEHFPDHRHRYDSWGVSSYLGVPLVDSRGQSIGVIAVMFGPGDHDQVLATTVLRLFATRAAGEMDRMLVEARRTDLENTLRAVVRGTASVVGEVFFSALVLELGRALGARAVYLTRLDSTDLNRVVRMAGVEDGKPLPMETVGLPVMSPTRDTMAAGFLHVTDSVRQRYPGNPALTRLQVDSFIGVALHSAKGETIGALTLLGMDPVHDAELARSMLLIFAARAAAEIQRIESDSAVALIDAQLRHTQKLEALGTLAGGISHDFNNILAGILGNTQLAQLAVDSRPDAVRKHLGLVVQGCTRARDLIARILAFSRNHDQPLQPCALGPLVHEALQLLEPGLPRNITLRTHLPCEDVHILADPGQIHQILLNLGTNAAHALSPRGGTLEVSVTEIAPDDPWRERHVQVIPEHTVRLSVRDDGPGIPVELHERIFEPFFTTKPVGQGSGLGLAGVHGMIRAHGGAIVLESAPGQGATFHLCFARCQARPRDPAAVVDAGGSGPRRLRVMYVDDERTITDIAAAGLRHLGWDPLAFTDAKTALAAFQEAAASFDVLVTDMAMPGMDGTTLVRAVRAMRPEIPVVMVTGFMRSQDIEVARQAGVRHFLSKPFELDTLNRLLRSICAGK